MQTVIRWNMPGEAEFRILIIDDQISNIEALHAVLSTAGYRNLKCLQDSRHAISVFSHFQPDLIVLDLHMPHLDGLTVIDQLARLIRADDYLPILVLTGDASSRAKEEALSRGAHDFLPKPLNRAEVLLRVKNLLQTRSLHLQLKAQNISLEKQVQDRTLQFAEAQVEVLRRLALAAEYRDDETGQHTQRVGAICAMLAEAIGESNQYIELLRMAAPLHDIGKIGIPDQIFLKAGRLTEKEFEIMKSHTTIGGEILSNSPLPILQLAHQIALSHHERWDGKGYPRGIAGEAIPLPGRIAAVADVFDALIHARPYKEAWPFEKAVTTIQNESGRHFDPRIVQAFLGIQRSGGLGNLAEQMAAHRDDRHKSRNALIESIR
jgi:putative two-component system response regulator